MIGAKIMSEKSKTFCTLPFIAVDVLAGKFSPCCLVDKKHFSNYTTIEEYYRSSELLNLQNNLKTNIKDPLCSDCWKNEENGIQSMRQSILQDSDRITYENKIQQVKLHVGKTCNLACMMCFPSVSSTWDKLWSEDKPEEYEKGLGHEHYDEYVENYIKENIKDIQYIETLGGEPLFSKRFFKLLTWITEQDYAKNITLYIITNLTILTPVIIKVLKDFKKVVLTVSLEGIGPVNDYIRWGSDFGKIDINLKEGLRNNFDVGILPTVSSLNIHRVHELYAYAESLRVPVLNITPVKGWTSLSTSNLPMYLHKQVDPRFKKLLIGDRNDRALKNFIQKWDRQRGISILDYMPEFEEFLKND